MRTFVVTTWIDGDGRWCAKDDFYRVEAEGGSSEDQAVDEVVGAVYAALAYRRSPPRSVEFRVVRREVGEVMGS